MKVKKLKTFLFETLSEKVLQYNQLPWFKQLLKNAQKLLTMKNNSIYYPHYEEFQSITT